VAATDMLKHEQRLRDACRCAAAYCTGASDKAAAQRISDRLKSLGVPFRQSGILKLIHEPEDPESCAKVVDPTHLAYNFLKELGARGSDRWPDSDDTVESLSAGNSDGDAPLDAVNHQRPGSTSSNLPLRLPLELMAESSLYVMGYARSIFERSSRAVVPTGAFETATDSLSSDPALGRGQLPTQAIFGGIWKILQSVSAPEGAWIRAAKRFVAAGERRSIPLDEYSRRWTMQVVSWTARKDLLSRVVSAKSI
jgi:hypothetical protein